MYSYYAEFLTRYPLDGSRGNYAWGFLSVQGECENDTIDWLDALDNASVQNELSVQYSIEQKDVHPSIRQRSIERVARTLGERYLPKHGGSLA